MSSRTLSGWWTHGVIRALCFGLILACCIEIHAADSYREPFRPQFHFTPTKNWMNDPNGMVYFDGEYHLFYQHNPFGDKWGHMSWGHAVSPDLVHWQHLPLALAEESDVMIFSGSAVVDWKNSSGFGHDDQPPLVAIYTGHYTKKPLQNQHIAFSTDRGRTWTKYSGNPVLDIGAKDFRDPKVFWHEPSTRWVMTVALPVERKVRFYSSPNLKQWELLSEFGPAGAVKGIWECPDLFPVPVEGSDRSKWVLIVNVGSESVAGGSGCQYFVGEFDGRQFIPETGLPGDQIASLRTGVERAHWVDFAKDFYAAVSWSDVPVKDGRRIWLGWMSNWQYAGDVPTAPWRNAMSVPRSLSLRQPTLSEGNGDRKDGSDWRLLQMPVQELRGLRDGQASLRLAGVSGAADLSPIRHMIGESYELELTLEPADNTVAELQLRKSDNEQTVLRFDFPKAQVTLDRSRSGKTDFHRDFPGAYHAPVRLIEGRLKLRLLVDTSSLEAFVNDGETVQTCLLFPSTTSGGLGLNVQEGSLRRVIIDAWRLRSAW